MPSLRTRRGDKLDRATEFYERSLHLALDYLNSRGITEEIARKYRLGYVERPCSGHERYAGRLAIPYCTPSGVVSLRFRLVRGEGAKYLSAPGDRGSIYNVQALHSHSPVVAICEGEADAIIVNEYAGMPAVGLPGVSTWKSQYERLFQDFQEVRVVVDGDAAGRGMAEKVCDLLDNAVSVVMPEGMDATDVYLQDGAEGLRKRLG